MSALTWPCAAVPEAELASRTTVRVGGRVEWLLEPNHPDQLVEAWNAARERGFTPRLLGGGANLLIDDGLHPGVVVTTDRMARVFRPHPEGGQHEGDEFAPSLPALVPLERDADARLVVWAGCSMPGLVRVTRELGWSGLEGLAGVPGHVGGCIAMNAGGRWGETWGVVESLRVLMPDGSVKDIERAQWAPRYRDGNLGAAIVLGAVLRFRVDQRAAVKERVADFLRAKSASQPVTERSSGCIFKNPDAEQSDGQSAGRLIDVAGCKGLEHGGAQVSPKHGNFIVNRGTASAGDVLALIDEVRARVAEHSGVRLETEVTIWRREAPE